MKTLSKYIVSEFLKLLAIAVVAFIVLFIMIDLFENMNNIMKNNVPLWPAATFFIYRIPFIVGQVAPIAVLLSVLLTLGILARHGEITAIKAGGIRLLGAFVPLFITGAIISAGVFMLNEYVAPITLRKADAFRRAWFSAQKRSFGAEGIWLRTDSGVVNIRQADFRKKELHGVTVFTIARPFVIAGRMFAREAVWKNGGWVADEAVVWAFGKDGRVVKTREKGVVVDGLYPPEELSGVEDIQKNMNLSELRRYVKNLEAEGYEAFKYKTDLYGRAAFPLVSFIMVFVGVPFALKTGRHSGIAAGIGLSVAIAFSYWVIFAMSKSLGSNGVVPPVVAAFFPDVLFLAAGAFMLGYVKE